MLMLLVQLTQSRMSKNLAFVSDNLQCTVLEVKQTEGLGYTIDVIVVNGVLHEGATIVVCGLQGPIVTTIRSLLTPKPMKELRVKGEYVHHKSIKAAIGEFVCLLKTQCPVDVPFLLGVGACVSCVSVQVSRSVHLIWNMPLQAPSCSLLVRTLALFLTHSLFLIISLGLFLGPKDDLEDLKDIVMGDLATVLSKVDKSGQGVYVQVQILLDCQVVTLHSLSAS